MIHFDELSQDERLNDFIQRFQVTIFYPIIDIITSQLENRFAGMKDNLNDYRVLQPQFLAHSSLKDLEQKADEFSNKVLNDVSPMFPSQLLSIRSEFEKEIISMKGVKNLKKVFLILL